MLMSTGETAAALDVSVQRVQAMLSDERFVARKIGSRWVIDSTSIATARRSGRAMTERNAWALIMLSDGVKTNGLRAEENYRLRARLGRLVGSGDDAAVLLRSWLANRAERVLLSASDTSPLLEDARLTLSGISDAQSGIAAHGEAEGYVKREDLASLVRDHALFRSEAGKSNVVLHVTEGRRVKDAAPLLLVAADLADYGTEREVGQAELLVSQVGESLGG
jgi:hypothetical protein